MMNPIDDFFRNKLSKTGISYDDSYWEAMETMLDSKKKKRKFPFFWLLALVLPGFLISGIVFYGFHHDRSGKIDQSTVFIDPPKSFDTSVQEKSKSFDEKQISRPKDIVLNAINVNTNINALRKAAPEKVNKQKENHDPLQNERKVPVPIPEVTAPGAIVVTKPKNEMKEKLLMIPNEKISIDKYLLTILNPYPLPELLEKTAIKQRDKLQNNWQYYFTAGYEFDQYSRKAIASKLKTQEKTRDQSGINLHFIAEKNHWGICTGLGLLTLSEVTNYITETNSYEFKTHYRMIDPNYKQTTAGTKIAIIRKEVDTLVTTSTSVNNPNNLVQFSYIKIPLLAIYQIRLKNFKIFAEVGMNTSFLIQQKGDYTAFENNQFSVKQGNNKSDFNNILFQSYTSLGIKYRIKHSMNIYGSYGYSEALNSMIKSYSQKPKIQLLTIGLEAKLN